MAKAKALGKLPSYRLHKPSGRAVVRLNGRDFYLGEYGTPESRAAYDEKIAEWLAHGRTVLPANHGGSYTVVELERDYWRWAEQAYKPKSRTDIKAALSRLKRLYGPTEVRHFGARALRTIQASMVAEGLSRTCINKYVNKIRGVFRWGVEHELVPVEVHQALTVVSGLRRGRTEAREAPPVRAVSDELVNETLEHLSPVVADMVRLQRLTGMRPGELCRMTSGALDTTGDVWIYKLEEHKTVHHGYERIIAIGPKAQDVLRPYLRTELDKPLFSPRESMERLRRVRAEARKTKRQPSQVKRAERAAKRKRRGRQPGESYTTQSYGRAINELCLRVGLPTWTPNQLRHNRATELRKAYGIDAAQVALGHANPDTTLVYAEADRKKLIEIARATG